MVLCLTWEVMCTKYEVIRPNNFGRKIQKLANDLLGNSDRFHLDDLENHDSIRVLCFA